MTSISTRWELAKLTEYSISMCRIRSNSVQKRQDTMSIIWKCLYTHADVHTHTSIHIWPETFYGSRKHIEGLRKHSNWRRFLNTFRGREGACVWCVCVHEYLLVSASVCVGMCVSVYMYVCICVYLCVCTQGRQSTIMGAMGDSHENYAIVKASLEQSEDWDVSNPRKSCSETSRSRTVPSLLWASMSWSTVCASHLSSPWGSHLELQV